MSSRAIAPAALKTAAPAATPSAVPAPTRVLSIDALRGFDMFWIVGGQEVVLALVTILGASLPARWVEWLTQNVDWPMLRQQMNHVQWSGFSAWDLIMPLFLFIVGAAMPFSFSARLEQGASKLRLYGRVLRRVLLLWVLGAIAQGNLLKFDAWIPEAFDSNNTDCSLHLFSNTLQAIAVGYLVAAIALMHFPKSVQVAFAALLVLGYWLILLFVPVPGQEAGLLEPKQNLALHIDEALLGRFRDGTTYTWILSGLGFGATALLGVFSGHLLRSQWSGLMKTLWLTLLGIGLLGLGLAWHGHFAIPKTNIVVEYDSPWLCPIIKHIWSSSMILYAAGWCYLLLALFYLVIDVIGLRRWAFFFIVIGANAIFAYMAVRLIPFSKIADNLFGGVARMSNQFQPPWPAVGQAELALLSFALLWLTLLYMYRKGTFLRV